MFKKMLCSSQSLPHARGGVSFSGWWASLSDASSPRTWGCFSSTGQNGSYGSVFPTHVGVFLIWRFLPSMNAGLPHARGGVSHQAATLGGALESSPRTWGCFPVSLCCSIRAGLPHARGGVSTKQCNAKAFGMSSPRTWGCFRFFPVRAHHTLVFPTHVGVFLPTFDKPVLVCRLPHARGGVSKQFVIVFFTALVFPTHVGVFLL